MDESRQQIYTELTDGHPGLKGTIIRAIEEIVKLRAELAAEREKHRWIPMEVEPKEGLYLLINKRWKKYKNYMLIEFDDFTGWQTYYPASFSHYMPLPSPPEQEVE